MTDAEKELIEAVLSQREIGIGSDRFEAGARRLNSAMGAVALERLGPIAAEIRQCIREQLVAQKRLRDFHDLPGMAGENGAIVAIWNEIAKELGV